MTTKKLPRKVDLNAPVDWVFVFLTAPGQLVEVMPSLAEVANAEEKPDGGHSFDSVYKMASLCLHGHSATSMVEPNKRVIVKTTGGIPSTFDDGYEVVGKGMRRTLTIDDTSPGGRWARQARRAHRPPGQRARGRGENEGEGEGEGEDKKVTLCHATGSTKNRYVETTSSTHALPTHARHQSGRDSIPAPREGCPNHADDCRR